MRAFANPTVAIAFGAFMLCAETCLHAESVLHVRTQWPDLPIHDWAAGGFLLIAGIASRRDWPRRWAVQAAAWGFMLSLLVAALFAYLSEWLTPPDNYDWFSEGTFLSIITVMSGIALAALTATLARRDQQSPGQAIEAANRT
jgi:hypothetical protein